MTLFMVRELIFRSGPEVPIMWEAIVKRNRAKVRRTAVPPAAPAVMDHPDSAGAASEQ